VNAPRCGWTVTLGLLNRGESRHGSVVSTSSPARATFPDSSARISAGSSITAPFICQRGSCNYGLHRRLTLAVLTMKTPSFIFANSASERRPRVSGVRGQFIEMISAVARSSSRDTYVASRAASSTHSELYYKRIHRGAGGVVVVATKARTSGGKRLAVVIDDLHIPWLGLPGHALADGTYPDQHSIRSHPSPAHSIPPQPL
jgi:hypothetical protein